MKRVLSIILVLAMLMALVACGKAEPEVTTVATTTAATTVATTEATTEATTAATTATTTAATTTAATTTTSATTTAAPEPQGPVAIKTAEDFAAMKADGEYYLDADITISATWNGGKEITATYAENTAFVGIFDGKGHTITTTAPLFANFAGTIKDLVIMGDITENTIGETVLHGGAVARWTNGEAYFSNIVNRANISGSKSTGALLGYGATGSVIVAEKCSNYGNFDCSDQVGGMFGYIQDTSVTITECINCGTLNTANYGGGIIGRFGRDAADIALGSLVVITDCHNTGTVTSAKGQTGGILGYLIGGAEIYDCSNMGQINNTTAQAGGIFGSTGDKASTTSVYIENCSNFADINGVTYVGGIAARVGRAAQSAKGNYRIVGCTNFGPVNATAVKDAAVYAAGIVAYAWGGSISEGQLPNGVIANGNYADVNVDATLVTSKDVFAAGVLGYVNSANYEIKYNLELGTLNVIGGAKNTLSRISYNKNLDSVASGMFANNYAVAFGDIVVAYAGEGEAMAPAAETAAVLATEESFESGEIAYLVNEAAGEVIYTQEIDLDYYPSVFEENGAIVYKWEDGTYANVEKATPITTAEEFAAMTADGAYYLANDITISASWNGGKEVTTTWKENVPFTGYFDGKGYTITTTAPLFASFSGIIKNLTVAGEINDAADYVSGGVTRWSGGNATFINVTNKANINGSTSTGGILGYGATGSNLVAIDCVNYGNFNVTSQVGGIFGYVQDTTAVIANCVNYGNAYTTNYGGGIIGRFGRDAADVKKGSLLTIYNCVNNGNITAAKSQVGGMVGYLVGGAEIYDCVNNGEIVNEAGAAAGILGVPKNTAGVSSISIYGCVNNGTIRGVTYAGGIAARVGTADQAAIGFYRVDDCVNNGDVYVTAVSDTAVYAGGISAYAWGGSISAGYEPNGTVGNVNYGKIIVDATTVATKDVFVGGILGYVNSANYEFKDNVNAGEITVTGGTKNTVALVGYNKNLDSVANGMFANNYALAAGETVAAYAGDPDASTFAPAAESAAVTFTAEQIAAGEISYLKDIDFQLK